MSGDKIPVQDVNPFWGIGGVSCSGVYCRLEIDETISFFPLNTPEGQECVIHEKDMDDRGIRELETQAGMSLQGIKDYIKEKEEEGYGYG